MPSRHVISEPLVGQRLDRVVGSLLPKLSRRELRELFERGGVCSGSRSVRKGEIAQLGQELEIRSAEELVDSADSAGVGADSEGSGLRDARMNGATGGISSAGNAPEIIAESDSWLVVNKPPGIASAPRHTAGDRSVATWLIERYPELANIGYRPGEAGLLSRLDTGTSGALLAAKTERAFAILKDGAKRGRLHKRYSAWTTSPAGPLPELIELALGPHAKNRRKVAWGQAIRGKPVMCKTRVLEQTALHLRSRLLLEVNTAYRHQIRAHLAYLGTPIAGDALYGAPPCPALSRHALHASALIWDGAPGLAGFEVEAPLAPDLMSWISSEA